MMHYSVVVVCGAMSMVAPLAAVPLTASEPPAGSVLDWYFRSRQWASWRHGAFYRFLGVRLFKRGLLRWYDSVMFQVQRLLFAGIFRRTPLTGAAWRRANGQHLKHDLPYRDALISAAKRTKRFELIHLFILLPLLPIVIDSFLGGHYTAGLLMGGVFALMNVYPILLQRDNRERGRFSM